MYIAYFRFFRFDIFQEKKDLKFDFIFTDFLRALSF